MALFLPTYFSPISQYTEIVKTGKIVLEVEDNFQKQTYRNRCYIYGANGKQLLNIPVKHLGNGKKSKTKDTLVDDSYPWQKQHLKSIQAAYSNSPFFEFYQDDLQTIFTKEYKFLLDINIDTFLFLMDALQLPDNYLKTTEYISNPTEDFRYLANAKQTPDINFDAYIQMFDEKHGFQSDLSMLDLLFMEGTNAINYLEKTN